MDGEKRLKAAFFATPSGNEPVREWLRALPGSDRKVIGDDIRNVERRWPVGLPTVRPLGGGLFEIRSDLPSNRIARILFCISGGRAVLLHGFIKKSQQTSASDLTLGRERQKAVP